MSRRKIIQESIENSELIPEIASRWSIKRIGITIVLLTVIAASIYYYFSLKDFSKEQPSRILGASDEKKQNKPEIKLPSKESINTIISEAKDSLSKIDTNNIVASQPEIQKIILDLQNLTKKDVNAKNVVCDLVCKK